MIRRARETIQGFSKSQCRREVGHRREFEPLPHCRASYTYFSDRALWTDFASKRAGMYAEPQLWSMIPLFASYL